MSFSPDTRRELRPYLAPRHVWALSLGTSVGWGSLVVTSNTYLAQAGPLGTVLGLVAGMAIMLVISRNYHFLMNAYPEAGGAYAYVRDVYGPDRGFLVAWFLALTYLAILWANVTSLPLFARIFIGDVFQFGRLYTIFGYDVYLGEALLSIAALAAAGALCMRFKRGIAQGMVFLVCVFFLGILFCCAAALIMRDRPLTPAYIPDSKALSQVITIAVISPWAFIGFENISHATGEFTFKPQKSFRILVTAVVTTTLLYVAVVLLSVTAYPPEYDSWLSYINDIGNLDGLRALPAFYAANHYLGSLGVWVLSASLLALILTSFFGNILALSRLIYALALDEILPARFAKVSKRDIPRNAIGLVIAVSCLIPFVGRTAIGWIVDVTTFGATMIYGFVSAAAGKRAAFEKDKATALTGRLGLVIMILFGLYLLVPNFFQESSMETETYFLFVIWAIFGLIFFYVIAHRDKHNRFGSAIVVWISFLSLILFVSLVWMSQYTMRATLEGMNSIQQYFSDTNGSDYGQWFVRQIMDDIRIAEGRSILVVVAMFTFSLILLVNNYNTMSRRAQRSEAELGVMKVIANTDPLTGVKNKLAYTDTEARLNDQISEHNAGSFAILVCDLNGLKLINDTLGHKAGDRYIREASSLICDHFKHSPVFRIGGDEFAVVLEGQDYLFRQELLQALDSLIEENVRTGGVVVSIGAAEYKPEHDMNVQSVFGRADARMYERKRQLKSMGANVRG